MFSSNPVVGNGWRHLDWQRNNERRLIQQHGSSQISGTDKTPPLGKPTKKRKPEPKPANLFQRAIGLLVKNFKLDTLKAQRLFHSLPADEKQALYDRLPKAKPTRKKPKP